MMNPHDFLGKVALVTGASRGIGKSIALTLAERGCDLAFCYRSDTKGAEDLSASVEKMGRNVLAVQADISREEDVVRLFEQTSARFGRLDILVNNAGQAKDGLLATSGLDVLQSVMAVNLIGPMLCCRESLKMMIPQRNGNIINISSVSASQANKGQTAYAAAKGGIEAFTRALAVELRGRGIRVNAVAPGVIETDMTGGLLEKEREKIKQRLLVKHLGRPEDISLAVLYLAHPENLYVTGEVLSVNGGLRLS